MNPKCSDYDPEEGRCNREGPCPWWSEEKYLEKNRGCIQ